MASLHITAVLDPPSVSRMQYDGWFTLTISISNPLDEPVWVRLSRMEPGHDAAGLFGFELDGLIKDYLWTYDARVAFGTHQTRRFTFDINTHQTEGIMVRLEPGQHSIRGFYNDLGEELLLVVVP